MTKPTVEETVAEIVQVATKLTRNATRRRRLPTESYGGQEHKDLIWERGGLLNILYSAVASHRNALRRAKYAAKKGA